jgi:proteasome lid subunit RPN8/RPN11
MIRLPPELLAEMRRLAEAAYPEECCGLLIGRREAEAVVVTRQAPSPNVTAGNRRRTFEVSPQVRFDLMRELRDGPETIVGHYHSHPDGAAEPSATDLAMAWEPDLAWVILAVPGGQAAFAVEEGPEFRAIDLIVGEST